MSENSEFAQRIIKMRIKYVLEKSQSQIVDEKKLRNIAAKVKEGESQSALAKDMQKLAITAIGKATPLLKDVTQLLLDDYLQTIKDITDEAIIEILNGEIQKIIKEEI
jgi:hypothetical protein